MEIRDTNLFRSLLETTLARHAAQEVDLIVVDEVAEWARKHCPGAAGNPLALAVRSRQDGSWGIVVRRNISDSEVRSVVSRIGFYRTTGEEQRLSTPELFLQHLVLHELAHLANDWDQTHEDDCDDWAFERLGDALSQETPNK